MIEDSISIVIPAYNEADRILPSLDMLIRFCRERLPAFEVVCVDDGSTDRTMERIHEAELPTAVRLIRLPSNQGKGAAVRAGMLSARGEFRFFTDADLPFDLDALEAAIGLLKHNGYDLVAGERTGCSSLLLNRPGRIRDAASRLFRSAAHSLVPLGVSDCQCGFKGFTSRTTTRLFGPLKTRGYAFDVELLARAQSEGMRVAAFPVRLVRHSGSKVRLSREPMRMLMDLVCIALRMRWAAISSKLAMASGNASC